MPTSRKPPQILILVQEGRDAHSGVPMFVNMPSAVCLFVQSQVSWQEFDGGGTVAQAVAKEGLSSIIKAQNCANL
jgi:hypothetical protein